MKLKIVSDLHCEFIKFNKFSKIIEQILPTYEDDKDITLVCAGDIGNYGLYKSTYKPFFNIMSRRFKYVVVVPGNHSFYGTNVWDTPDKIWEGKKIPKNVFYLDNSFVELDGVVFVGSCLWTDFDKNNPMAKWYAQKNMSDYEVIRTSKSRIIRNYEQGTKITINKLTPDDVITRNKISVDFFMKFMTENPQKPIVVVTHHAPTVLSITDLHRGSALSPAYHNNLENFIFDNPQIKYWIHGHIHDSINYEIGDTKIICNPYGYFGVNLNKGFNPNLVVEV